jgi:hypothetical protein
LNSRLVLSDSHGGRTIALIATLILSHGLYGATYYVATTGSDANAGTQSAPFATIQRGVDLAKPGDTILVENGTYGPNGHYTCGTQCSQSGYSAPVSLRNSGTASAPITIAAQNKWGAVLDCQLPYGYSGDGTDGVQACDAYFNFQGSASYITISGFDIQRAYWVGAMVNATNTHVAFIGNHFHNIGNRIYTVPSGTSSYGIVGVYAGTGSSYITWDGNEFNNIGRVPHTGSVISDDYSHDHGLYIYNGPYTITNNIFYGQAAGWDVQTSPGSHDISIVNNTMIGGANPQKDGCMILWGQNTNVTIVNNIFYNGRNYAIDNYATSQSGSLIDHNIVHGSPSGMIAVSGITQTNNRLNTDPLFTAPSSNDYHLQAGSPAIDTGAAVSLNSDFDGNPRPLGTAFDVGAYEWVGSEALPVAPSGLTATAGSSGVVSLTWVDNSAATALLLERSTDNITFLQVASLGGTSRSWSDSGLAASQTYYYRVRAQNSAGSSGYSNTASVLAAASGNGGSGGGTLPPAPTNVAAGQSSISPRTQINVYWSEATTSGLIGFGVFRSLDGINFNQIAMVGSSARQYDDPGLSPNTKYYYCVKAISAAGMSAASNIDSTITQQ